jgi:hypothetical protein
MQSVMDIKEIRRKVKETSEKELIMEAIRARKFSGFDSLREGMKLIDFALRINKDHKSSMRGKIVR